MHSRFLKTSLLALALALPLTAQASITLTLTPASQPLLPGGTVLFSGTISNSIGSAEVFLNALNLNLTGLSNTFLVSDPTPFFAGAPLSLLGGDSYTGGLFNITMAGGAPGGTYFGIAELLGGATGGDLNPLDSAQFSVVNPAGATAPEPVTLSLCLLGLAGGLARRRRSA